MANISFYHDSENGTIVIDGVGNSTSNRVELTPDDVLTFSNTTASGFGSVTVSSFRSDQFTSTSSLSLSKGQNGARTVKSSPNFTTDTITFAKTGAATAYAYINITSGADTDPNDFNIGIPVRGADLGVTYYFEEFKVRSISEPVAVSVNSNSAMSFAIKPDGGSYGSWVTSGNVSVNDFVKVRGTASSSYNTQVVYTLNIGSNSDSNTIKTKTDPAQGTFIAFPYTTNISLKKVSEFFAAPLSQVPRGATVPRYMSAYRRGGLYVPDVTQNASIATTDQAQDLKLSSFSGSGTTVYFNKSPANKIVSMNVIGGSATASIAWVVQADWTLGHSPSMGYNAEYRYTFIEFDPEGPQHGTGATLSATSGDPFVYDKTNTGFAIEATSSGTFDQQFQGEITMYMRSLLDTSVVLTQVIGYTIDFYGN